MYVYEQETSQCMLIMHKYINIYTNFIHFFIYIYNPKLKVEVNLRKCVNGTFKFFLCFRCEVLRLIHAGLTKEISLKNAKKN